MEVEDSLFVTVFLLVFMSFLALFAILGNGIVLGIIARFKMVRTFPNILIANLALANFFQRVHQYTHVLALCSPERKMV